MGATNIEYNATSQVVKLSFPEQLLAGEDAVLRISFSGIMNNEVSSMGMRCFNGIIDILFLFF